MTNRSQKLTGNFWKAAQNKKDSLRIRINLASLTTTKLITLQTEKVAVNRHSRLYKGNIL